MKESRRQGSGYNRVFHIILYHTGEVVEHGKIVFHAQHVSLQALLAPHNRPNSGGSLGKHGRQKE
jgi:hypothetical protein